MWPEMAGDCYYFLIIYFIWIFLQGTVPDSTGKLNNIQYIYTKYLFKEEKIVFQETFFTKGFRLRIMDSVAAYR